jgi:predicted nucleic acid-binding Zn ribbon protein
MTDGLLNKTIPPLLDDQVIKTDNAYLFYLYDNLRRNPDLGRWVSDELTHILPQEVNHDDITMIAAMCKSVRIKLRKDGYYSFPGEALWNSLLENHKNRLYAYKAGKDLTEETRQAQTRPADAHQTPVPVQTASTKHRSSNRNRRNENRRRKRKLLLYIILMTLIIILTAVVIFLIYYVIREAIISAQTTSIPQEGLCLARQGDGSSVLLR